MPTNCSRRASGSDGWPEKVLTMQRNWIGRSEGARVRFALAEPPAAASGQQAAESGTIEVFTTRIDTIYGATFILLAPEHPLVQAWAGSRPTGGVPRGRRDDCRSQDRSARMTGEVEKEGFDTGRTAINPFTGRPVPIWVANFVLGDYGTGAVMGVPGHDQRDFEFARKYSLPVTIVVQPDGADLLGRVDHGAPTRPGTLVNSGEFNGLDGPTRPKR